MMDGKDTIIQIHRMRVAPSPPFLPFPWPADIIGPTKFEFPKTLSNHMSEPTTEPSALEAFEKLAHSEAVVEVTPSQPEPEEAKAAEVEPAPHSPRIQSEAEGPAASPSHIISEEPAASSEPEAARAESLVQVPLEDEPVRPPTPPQRASSVDPTIAEQTPAAPASAAKKAGKKVYGPEPPPKDAPKKPYRQAVHESVAA